MAKLLSGTRAHNGDVTLMACAHPDEHTDGGCKYDVMETWNRYKPDPEHPSDNETPEPDDVFMDRVVSEHLALTDARFPPEPEPLDLSKWQG